MYRPEFHFLNSYWFALQNKFAFLCHSSNLRTKKRKIRHKDGFEEKAYYFNLIMTGMFPHTSGAKLVPGRTESLSNTQVVLNGDWLFFQLVPNTLFISEHCHPLL